MQLSQTNLHPPTYKLKRVFDKFKAHAMMTFLTAMQEQMHYNTAHNFSSLSHAPIRFTFLCPNPFLNGCDDQYAMADRLIRDFFSSLLSAATVSI